LKRPIPFRLCRFPIFFSLPFGFQVEELK